MEMVIAGVTEFLGKEYLELGFCVATKNVIKLLIWSGFEF